MVNASKILTVSYGTFSCTLEGFDDPFSTMRSIAEYFRDLAADDRFFGAEPPTPDAEMLHRIAEREINRRVEAKVQSNGVVLRQIADDAPRTAPIATPAKTEASTPRKSAGPAPVAAPNRVSGAPESVAAKLARIRAAVARTQGEPLLGSVFADDERAEELPALETEDLSEALAETPEVETSADTPEDTATRVEIAEDEAAEDDDATQTEDATAEMSLADLQDVIEPPVAVEKDDSEKAGVDEQDETEEVAAAEPEAEETTEVSLADLQDVIEPPVAVEKDDSEMAGVDEQDETEEVAAAEPEAEETTEVSLADLQDLIAPSEEATGTGDDDIAKIEEPETATIDEAETARAEGPEPDASTDDWALASSDDADEAEPEDAGPSDESADEIDMAAIMAASDDETAPADEATDEVKAETTPDVLLTDAEIAEQDGDKDEDEIHLSSVLADAHDEGAQDADVDWSDADDTIADVTEAEDTPAAPRARVVKMTRKAFEEQFIEAEFEDADEASASITETMPGSSEHIRASLGDTGLSREDEDDLINELAEVERDAEREMTHGTSEADLADNSALVLEPHQMKVAPDGLADSQTKESPDAIAAALKEVAAEATDKQSKIDDADAEQKHPVEDVSVDRLLAQTDSELQSSEGSRRRSAIAHLKAAVAAVRADGGRPAKDAQKDEAKALGQYRDDLARAVRPESDLEPDEAETPKKFEGPVHPRPAPAGSVRPKRRMPPLMLVSEQRIDRPTVSDADAPLVRPRRVHTEELDEDVDDVLSQDHGPDEQPDAADDMSGAGDEFKRFVDDSGAEGMQELLEASAAFGSQVEGKANCTRPQILRRVIKIMPEGTYSREDGLRAFGVLLRENRIQRVERGRFTIGASSRFNPPKKSAMN